MVHKHSILAAVPGLRVLACKKKRQPMQKLLYLFLGCFGAILLATGADTLLLFLAASGHQWAIHIVTTMVSIMSLVPTIILVITAVTGIAIAARALRNKPGQEWYLLSIQNDLDLNKLRPVLYQYDITTLEKKDRRYPKTDIPADSTLWLATPIHLRSDAEITAAISELETQRTVQMNELTNQ